MKKHITLICTPLRFYSHKDEDALFEWLYKIESVKKIQGIGQELHIDVNLSKLSYTDICDFIGIFKRYKFRNYNQLEQLNIHPDFDAPSDNKTKHRNTYPHRLSTKHDRKDI